jgi:hypothetical protein
MCQDYGLTSDSLQFPPEHDQSPFAGIIHSMNETMISFDDGAHLFPEDCVDNTDYTV